jgi:hypothetical protein
MGGALTWEEVAQYRDRWKGTLIVKGILHPQDAEKAAALGVDGLFVSNHGGRQIDALPGPIDALPAIARQVGSRVTVMYDSGIRSGTDVVRLCARRRRRVRRQGLPVGAWRARRRGAEPRHRSSHRGDARRVRPIGRAHSGRSALGRHPP